MPAAAPSGRRAARPTPETQPDGTASDWLIDPSRDERPASYGRLLRHHADLLRQRRRRTSGTPTRPSPPTCWRATTALRGRGHAASSPAPTSTARRSRRPPRQRGARRHGAAPTASSSRFQDAWEQLDISNDDFIRTTEPRHEESWCRSCGSSSLDDGRHLPRRSTRAGTASAARRSTPRRQLRARRQAPVPHAPTAELDAGQGGVLLLPHVGVRERAARAHRGPPRVRPAGDPPQRGASPSSSAGCATSPSRAPRSSGASRCPATPKHVIYVWIDALSNYITALGGPAQPTSTSASGRPADVHLIGKDILALPRGLLADAC